MIYADAIRNGPQTKSVTGKYWTAAKPIPAGSYPERIRDAWWVLTGRAEAVMWDEDLRPRVEEREP